jgi:hypothetical protein
MAVLGHALQQTDRGELDGSILITESKEGTRFYTLGVCKDRLQVGAWSMIKGLHHIGQLIVDSGTAGNTKFTEPVAAEWPKRTLPKRLREATGFGELE